MADRVPLGDESPPYVQQLPAPIPPKARWIGETRTLRRTIEDPTGTPVEVEVERVPSEFVQGVPARDLSDQEYQQLTAEQRRVVETCGMYEVRAGAPASDAEGEEAQGVQGTQGAQGAQEEEGTDASPGG